MAVLVLGQIVAAAGGTGNVCCSPGSDFDRVMIPGAMWVDGRATARGPIESDVDRLDSRTAGKGPVTKSVKWYATCANWDIRSVCLLMWRRWGDVVWQRPDAGLLAARP